MGMFDSVMVPCAACSRPVEFQTKAGRCELDVLTPDEMSPAMKVDIALDRQRCTSCGTWMGARLAREPEIEFYPIPADDTSE